jgi:N6-L-threonylcarbamoyladenine synthase
MTTKCLAIETSCDETAVAIVDDNKNIIANIVKSQIDLHQIYGGVVPEIAARAHLDVLDDLIKQALINTRLEQIDIFAATCGPGLIGGLVVGVTAAKTLSAITGKPFFAVNHLAGHALTARLTNQISFPYLLLLISGGHCQILLVSQPEKYVLIGQTIDDSLGECFDKVAQMLNLGYPGGPAIEKQAINGNPNRFKFSLPLISKKNHQNLCNFSFSGLKTAVRLQIEKISPPNQQDIADISASFQATIGKILIDRLSNVVANRDIQNIVIAGGVAANRYILTSLQNWAKKYNIQVIAPPIKLCTDNAAMIAWAALERQKSGHAGDDLSFAPRPRWQL